MRTFYSVKGSRRWLRMGFVGRCRQVRKDDLGKLRWWAPARQERWKPHAEEC